MIFLFFTGGVNRPPISDFLEESQKLATSARVVLFKLDASGIGGNVYYFSPNTLDGQSIIFDSNTYFPMDIESEGWEVTGKGTLPQPKIRISNVQMLMSSIINEFGDLTGATLTRIRTYKNFLDGQPDENPGACVSDIFTVSRKSAQNRLFVEWELSPVMDQQGRMLPGRQYLKDACTHIYRVYTGGVFVYTKATCPYAGTAYFNRQGGPTDEPSLDSCGKRFSDCRVRFGKNSTLPFRGFPGIGKTP